MQHLQFIHLKHKKDAHDSQTTSIFLPKKLVLTLPAEKGSLCNPLVQIGEHVKKGQLLGEAVESFSVPVHAPAAGTVTDITEGKVEGIGKVVQISIDTVEEDTAFLPPQVRNREDLIAAVRASGMVGLGGAGFPTFIKLSAKNMHTLVVNVAECEPYITADYRTVLEDTDDVFRALSCLKEHLGLEKIIFGIEDNKPLATRLLERMCVSLDGFAVHILKTRYPQGAEKVLLYEAAGIVLPEGALPAQVGALVLNITTLAKIGLYLRTGEPLITKRVTVDGDLVKNPCNLEVPIGTSVEDIADFVHVDKEKVRKVLFGGPMMGVTVPSLMTPILKNTNAVLFFSQNTAERADITPCMRCGRCYRACPFSLQPMEFERQFRKRDRKALTTLHLQSCIECGNCSYVCPAKRDLVQNHRLAKRWLKGSPKR